MKRRNRCTLTVYWVRWRRYRFQSLIAQGLNGDLAWEVSDADAKHRHSIGKIIGRAAARDAEIVALGADRFVVPGSVPSLTDSQVEAIEALNSRAMPKAA